MPFLQWLVLVATALLCVDAASVFGPLARAADPLPAVHEAAALDRIFVNWKARHDRVHSIHFTVDCRTTYWKGAWDFSTRTRLDRDQVFEQVDVQVWMDSDDRICLVSTPLFKVPRAKLADLRRVASRSVIVGKTTSTLFASQWLETGGPPDPPFAQFGTLHRSAPVDRGAIETNVLHALLLTFRPQCSSISWQREGCHLVDENAVIDNGHYVKFQRVLERSPMVPRRREEACWVSPAREDVIVHWTIQSPPEPTRAGSIKYQKDTTYGWVPSEWTWEAEGDHLCEYKVTSYAINEKLHPATFSQEFPAGTRVAVQLGKKEAFYHYVVQPDGSKRTISREDFLRLARSPDPLKELVPAKPQAK
jgi:hypothetical protein